VPLTSTIRGYRSEVTIEPDPDNGLEATSAAQCQHTRAIALGRLADPLGNIGPQALTQIRKIALTSSTCSDPHDATVIAGRAADAGWRRTTVAAVEAYKCPSDGSVLYFPGHSPAATSVRCREPELRMAGSTQTTAPTPPEPSAYLNWRARENGETVSADMLLYTAAEYAFYTDASFRGELDLDPYLFINTLSGLPGESLAVHHAMTLRAGIHHPMTPSGDLATSSNAGWTGQQLDGEVAALASLALGIRCKSGGVTRWFRGPDDLGKPVNIDHRPQVLEFDRRGRQHIPNAATGHDIGELRDLLHVYPRLAPQDAIALTRTALAYQQALWQVEQDPEYAWLKLISAVEAAATRWAPVTLDAVELLREWKPDLLQRLDETGGADLVQFVAAQLFQITRSTRKFVDFIVAHADAPPPVRPTYGQVDWDTLPRLLRKVYAFRSTALHAGQAIPGPLIDYPHQVDDGPPPERPWSASGIGYAHHVWTLDELPMHLHFFEFVVRSALQNWWRELPTIDHASRRRGAPESH
jgi:hypothetical protein